MYAKTLKETVGSKICTTFCQRQRKNRDVYSFRI